MADHHEDVGFQEPDAEDLATRLFALSIAGILGFIAIVFIFIL